jgi:hypothetical protein
MDAERGSNPGAQVTGHGPKHSRPLASSSLQELFTVDQTGWASVVYRTSGHDAAGNRGRT